MEKKSRKICLNNYIPIKKIPTVKFDLLSESDLKNRLNLKFIFILDLRFYVEEVLYKTRNPILANFPTKQIQVVYLVSVVCIHIQYDHHAGIWLQTLGFYSYPWGLYSNPGIVTPTLGYYSKPWDFPKNPGILLNILGFYSKSWDFTPTREFYPALGFY